MTIARRATPLHPSVFTFAELEDLLVKRIDSEQAACFDGETIDHIGQTAHHRAEGRLSAYQTVREYIAAAVAEEADERARERAIEVDLEDPSLGAGGAVEAYRG
ncbi:MAG: hypothetical protein IT341_10495 [Chloroflexi bacterium]|nr:hypothetical protein [Chloroflexota bacterium]